MNLSRRLSQAALVSLAVHLIAGLAMALVLIRGLETNTDLQDRLHYVAEHSGAWRAAWTAWSVAALSILYFFIAFARAHVEYGSPMRLAVLLGAVGVVADLGAEAIEMILLPGQAARALADAVGLPLVLSTHRVAVLLSGFLANGLYTTAAVLLAWSARRAYPRWVFVAAMGVGAAGIWLSTAALFDSMTGMLWSTMALAPCVVVWQVGVAAASSVRARVEAPAPSGTKPLAVYDASCGICAGNLPWLHRLDWLGAFDDLPYQSEEAYRLFPRLNRSDCEQALQLAFPDGRIFSGADAFREVFLRMPVTLPAGLLMAVPPLPRLLRRLYPILARNRYRLGGHCVIDSARLNNHSQQPK